MSVTSTRTIQVGFDGDVAAQQSFSALENQNPSGESLLVTLSTGANIMIPPTVSGVVNTGLTIIPPSGNTTVITLMGVPGDTGFPLHLTDPVSLSLGTGFVSITLSVPSDLAGVRLIWS